MFGEGPLLSLLAQFMSVFTANANNLFQKFSSPPPPVFPLTGRTFNGFLRAPDKIISLCFEFFWCTGETSAGKSSVINLILGEEVLPSGVLSTTSTICELKYGEKKMINVHFKDDGTQTRDPEKYELNESPDENYTAQISRFVSLKTDRDKTPYKKIEMFWPHPLLKVMKKDQFRSLGNCPPTPPLSQH